MPRTKSIVYKHKYSEKDPIPELNVNQIGELLVNANKLPHFCDYEFVIHDVHFRNVREGTRNDFIFHYVDLLPISKRSEEEDYIQTPGYEYKDIITKVNIVSFFTNSKRGKYEHRIYQIGSQYGSDDLSLNDLYGLGELNYVIKNYEKAIKFYDKALEFEPEDIELLTSLGLAYESNGEYEKAIQMYQKAYDLDPENSEIEELIEEIQNKKNKEI